MNRASDNVPEIKTIQTHGSQSSSNLQNLHDVRKTIKRRDGIYWNYVCTWYNTGHGFYTESKCSKGTSGVNGMIHPKTGQGFIPCGGSGEDLRWEGYTFPTVTPRCTEELSGRLDFGAVTDSDSGMGLLYRSGVR